jgi:hypothetical protein
MRKSRRARLANTGDNQNRFNPLWLEAINQTLLDRGHHHLLASIPESLWNRHIEPMLDALEKGAFDGPDGTMRNRKRLGYQVIDAANEMPRGWVSFGIYTLADCRRAIAEDKERWQLVTVFEGDIEEPTFMRSLQAPRLRRPTL